MFYPNREFAALKEWNTVITSGKTGTHLPKIKLRQ